MITHCNISLCWKCFLFIKSFYVFLLQVTSLSIVFYSVDYFVSCSETVISSASFNNPQNAIKIYISTPKPWPFPSHFLKFFYPYDNNENSTSMQNFHFRYCVANLFQTRHYGKIERNMHWALRRNVNRFMVHKKALQIMWRHFCIIFLFANNW